MKKIELNDNWSFWESQGTVGPSFQKEGRRVVSLPHDFIIEKPRDRDVPGGCANGFFAQGEGTYERELGALEEWKNKVVLLDVDGAYMQTEVLLNEYVCGIHPYGYSPFQIELTPALNVTGLGNKLKLITQSRQPSTRFYSGGGLYREVCLWIGEQIYVNPWEVFVSTAVAEKACAAVRVQALVSNRRPRAQRVRVFCEILDQGVRVAAREEWVFLPERGEQNVELFLGVAEPRLWFLENPHLYTWRVTVSDRERIWDVTEDTFGIRTISYSAGEGFLLNGKQVKMKGGCIHHDNGLLGACAYPAAEERKIRTLQEAGYNAVRISHYPPSLEMLRACDRLGMLLLDECFDCWNIGKSSLDYHLYFTDWWERDMISTVKRDRNHPCVVAYSTGNEVGERTGLGDGALWSKELHQKLKELDPTRPTLSTINGVTIYEGGRRVVCDAEFYETMERDDLGELTEPFLEPLDIAGYNYLYFRYEDDHRKWPNRVMIGTETHAFTTYDSWKATEKYPYVLGDFIWTAYDYFGEAGLGRTDWDSSGERFDFDVPFPWRCAWCGDFTITGERRPQSYYRELLWEHTDGTFLYTRHPGHNGQHGLASLWGWPELRADWSFGSEWVGQPVQVTAYGPGDEAEFILNGRTVGRAAYRKLTAVVEIPYEEGELKVISYREGERVSQCRLRSTGRPRKFAVEAEQEQIRADRRDLAYLKIRILDASGELVPTDEQQITVQMEGPGEIVAFGSGNPATEDEITDHFCHVYEGRALLILKAKAPGTITVKLSGEGMEEREIVLEAFA